MQARIRRAHLVTKLSLKFKSSKSYSTLLEIFGYTAFSADVKSALTSLMCEEWDVAFQQTVYPNHNFRPPF